MQNSENQAQTQKIRGKSHVLQALSSNASISKIWISDKKDPKLSIIEKIARDKKIPIATDKRVERGVEAEIVPIEILPEEFLYANCADFKRILIPHQLEDPHNLGAIVRTCVSFAVDALLISTHNSVQVTETVVNSSAGAIFNLPIIRIGNPGNCLRKLKDLGFWVYGTDLAENSQDYSTVDYDGKSVIVMGNEGKGLSDAMKKNCDFLIHIPIEFNSLNVSVATGVLLSHIYRQEKAKQLVVEDN